MRILFVAPYIPSSLRVRPYRLIQYLAKNHEITFAGIVQPSWTSRFLDDIKPLCKAIYAIDLNQYSCMINSLLALPSGKPMSVAYFSSNQMKYVVKHLVQDSSFDLIHTEFIRAAPYTADLMGVPKLFDAVDCLSLAYERGWRNLKSGFSNRIIAFEEWIKMRHYEPKMMQSFDQVVVSSHIDQKYLATRPKPSIEILPNGVDFDYFYWDKQERDVNSIVFVGQMNYYVNVDSVLHFYKSTFRLIQKYHPNIRFSIVGADPKKSVRTLKKDSAVDVTSYVPDIRPYLARAAVFVCPMICGSGIQNKILHAMAMGTPIVSTSIAIQALNVKDGEHLLVADEPHQFAESVMSLLEDNNLRKRLSSNARDYIQANHDWSAIGKKLEAIYERML